MQFKISLRALSHSGDGGADGLPAAPTRVGGPPAACTASTLTGRLGPDSKSWAYFYACPSVDAPEREAISGADTAFAFRSLLVRVRANLIEKVGDGLGKMAAGQHFRE